jgi:hypothetical protein
MTPASAADYSTSAHKPSSKTAFGSLEIKLDPAQTRRKREGSFWAALKTRSFAHTMPHRVKKNATCGHKMRSIMSYTRDQCESAPADSPLTPVKSRLDSEHGHPADGEQGEPATVESSGFCVFRTRGIHETKLGGHNCCGEDWGPPCVSPFATAGPMTASVSAW